MPKRCSAFTIIELLIIVAIVAVLTIITVPNIMMAKSSAEVARAKEDMRALIVGLESYRLDHQDYPRMNIKSTSLLLPNQAGSYGQAATLERLTTPISYLNGAMPFYDPFEVNGIYSGVHFDVLNAIPAGATEGTYQQYFYTARNSRKNALWGDFQTTSPTWYLLESAGPDKKHHSMGQALNYASTEGTGYDRVRLGKTIYDPTNGTISRGSIWDTGGTAEGNGSVVAEMINDANSSRVNEWDQMTPGSYKANRRSPH